jgi:predicted DNA-binding protein with PD1-like motif
MESRETRLGRRILVLMRPGDDVLGSLVDACREHRIEQGIVTSLLGAFTSVTLIATHEPIADHDAPLGDSITVEGVEGTGAGTLASSAEGPVPHVHVAVGVKADGAVAYSGHLLAATAHYVVEATIDEVLHPPLVRRVDVAARGLATLAFG